MAKNTVLSIVVGFVLGISPLSFWYFIGVNTYIPSDLAKTIFVALIQVNGALIAFFGVILVHNLRKYSNHISNATNHAIHFLEQIQEIECDIDYNKNNQDLVNYLNRKRNNYVKNSDQNAAWILETNKKRSSFSNKSIYPVIGFVLSILACVLGLTKITFEGIVSEVVVIALIPLFFSIVILILSLGSSIPSLSPDLQKRMNAKTVDTSSPKKMPKSQDTTAKTPHNTFTAQNAEKQ